MGSQLNSLDVVKVEASRTARLSEIVLRLVVFAATATAAAVMAFAKETTTVIVHVSPTISLPVTATAKSSYSSAFVKMDNTNVVELLSPACKYFLVANATACIFSLVSLLATIKKNSRRKVELLIWILDLVMVALLLSGNGAAAAVGMLAEQGNSHTKWNKICNVYGRYCNQVSVSMAVSLLGSLNYLLLFILAIVGLHKRSR